MGDADERSTSAPSTAKDGRGNGVQDPQRGEVPLGTIAIRQVVRVNRQDGVDGADRSAEANPMNRLVPYLDLFGRLSDQELARLASVPSDVAENLRKQVIQVDRALTRFTDLLPRLTDAELVRLTNATPKTIRFWRLCQPRLPMAGQSETNWSVARAAEALGQVASSVAMTLPAPAPTNPTSSPEPRAQAHADPPAPVEPPARRTAEEPPRAGAPAYRMPAAERESGSFRHRGPATADPTSPPGSASAVFSAPPDPHSTTMRYSAPAAGPPSAPESASTEYRHRSSKEIPAIDPAGHDAVAPRRRSSQEIPSVDSDTTAPPDGAQPQSQQAASEQMGFDGAPFPGYDHDTPMPPGDEDGIFIGLELPDPRNLPQQGPAKAD